MVVPRRSLYVMSGSSRYDFTHEILPNDYDDDKVPRSDLKVDRGRRVSIICRCRPDEKRAEKS